MSERAVELEITHSIGLHARPAVKFTKLAKTFGSRISIQELPDGKIADAKSVAKVMGLKIKGGRTVRIDAQGEDAEPAITALGDLIRRNFDE